MTRKFDFRHVLYVKIRATILIMAGIVMGRSGWGGLV